MCGKAGNKLIFTKDGGKVSDENGYITQYWKWDQTRQNPGQVPTEPIVLQLNKELKFIFTARDKVEVQFSCESFTMAFDVGLKLKRTDCYLSKCTTIKNGPHRGKKVFEEETLKAIQKQGEEDAFNKSQKVSARTTKITNPEILAVADGHQEYFDAYKARHKKQG